MLFYRNSSLCNTFPQKICLFIHKLWKNCHFQANYPSETPLQFPSMWSQACSRSLHFTFQHQKTRQRRSEGTQQNKEASVYTCTWPPDLPTCERRITRGPAKKSNCLKKSFAIETVPAFWCFYSPLFFKWEISMFLDMFSWWSRTAEKAKQVPTEVIDRNPKAARLGFLITPDPISAAHVTGTPLQNDSGMQPKRKFRALFFPVRAAESSCHFYTVVLSIWD